MREVGRADHASTEQLSALLDGRAEPHEQSFLAGHVDQCTVCSNELADLRSVRDLLRALPVYLPPRSFTIPIELARPARRFRHLIPLTRALGTVAAVLCVVLFSVDAMQTGYDVPMSAPDTGAGAMYLTTRPTQEAAEAAKPAEPRAAARAVSEPGQPADAAAKIANAPAAPVPPAAPAPPAVPAKPAEAAAQPAGALAPAQQAPAAAAKPQAEASQPAPRPTSAASAPVAPAPTSAPGQAAGAAPGVPTLAAQRPPVPTAATSLWLSPIRLWSLAFALVAAALLIASIALSRLSRRQSGPADEWTRS